MAHPIQNGTEVEVYGQNFNTSDPIVKIQATVINSVLDGNNQYRYKLQASNFGDGNISETVTLKDVAETIVIEKE